jgi:hypothetical protein
MRICLLLAAPILVALAVIPVGALEASPALTAAMDLQDGFRARLVLPLPGAGDDGFVLLRASGAGAASDVSPAIRTPRLLAGPAVLGGSYRELFSPHLEGAAGTSWSDASEVRLDTSLRPVSRRAFAYTLPRRFQLALIEPGNTVHYAGATAYAPGRVWSAETLVLVGRVPDTPPAAAEAETEAQPWFGVPAGAGGSAHLLVRAHRASAGDHGTTLHPAFALAFPADLPAGLWARLAARHRSAEGERSALVSFSSPAYRVPSGGPPDEALAAAIDWRRNARGGERFRAAAHALWAWRPEMTFPGVPFSLRGLALEAAGGSVVLRARTGTAGTELGAQLGAYIVLRPAQTPVRPPFACNAAWSTEAELTHSVAARGDWGRSISAAVRVKGPVPVGWTVNAAFVLDHVGGTEAGLDGRLEAERGADGAIDGGEWTVSCFASHTGRRPAGPAVTVRAAAGVHRRGTGAELRPEGSLWIETVATGRE